MLSGPKTFYVMKERTLKTKHDSQAVYCIFDSKNKKNNNKNNSDISLKRKKAWTVDIARSLAMLQKNT